MIISFFLLLELLRGFPAAAYSQTCFTMADKAFNHADIYKNGRTEAIRAFCTDPGVEQAEADAKITAEQTKDAVAKWKLLLEKDQSLADLAKQSVTVFRSLRSQRMICVDSEFPDPRCEEMISKLTELSLKTDLLVQELQELAGGPSSRRPFSNLFEHPIHIVEKHIFRSRRSHSLIPTRERSASVKN